MKQTNWLNQNQSIENITLLEVPKHRVYVDVLGNGGSFLLQKRPSRLEVFNDTNQALLSFLLAANANKELVVELPTQHNAITRLRNIMIEKVDVERLVGIYDGPDTLFYLDIVHYNVSDQQQMEILLQFASVEGKVMLLAPTNLVLPEWNKVSLSNEMHLLMNFQNEQMSLFTFASMEGVMNHD